MDEDYGFCRICLKIKSETFSIYQTYKNEFLPSLIYNVSGVTINQVQESTAVICKQCALAILVAYKIILRCQESQEYMITQQKREQLNHIKDEEVESIDILSEGLLSDKLEESADTSDENVDDKCLEEEFISYENIEKENQCESMNLNYDENLEVLDFKVEESNEKKSTEPLARKRERKIAIELQYRPRNKSSSNHIFCNLCDFNTTLAKEFITHRSVIHNINDKNIYACKVCPQRFAVRQKLFKHIEEVHQMIPEEKKYVCSSCGKTYCRATHLSLHKKDCHSPRSFKCDYCNQNFSRSFTLKRHIQAIHSNNPIYYCETCNKSFKVYDNWKYHNDVIHKNHIVYCPKCGFGFRQKDKLDEHLANNHCKKAIIPCDYCQRKFTTPGGLITHMKNIHRF